MQARPSSLVLLVANLLPVGGVVLYGWDLLSILLVYWSESVLVGLVNVLRMIRSESRGMLRDMLSVPLLHRTANLRHQHLPGMPPSVIRFILVPFFLVHYGLFCFAHLSVLLWLFSAEGLSHDIDATLAAVWLPSLWLPVAGLAASHLYSYMRNFVGNGEYRRTNVIRLMQRPYGRILVMHVTIIGGGAAILWLGSPLPMLVLLIAAKSLMDVRLHELERRRFETFAG